ncbi:MAG: NAD(P)/FAD-dependent oxidoreductase [Pseudopedobacter sp.]|nr:NAD(P)/FAD-dependent oxidoreductase [Deinococcales bacterium]
MLDYDVIVVGAGHNALVSAAYAAKAGYKVGVFERRAIVGGAVATEEHVPGYKFDLGGSAHILIRMTPIVEELDLKRYGLEYLELDPLFHASDGETPWFVWRDVNKTVDALEGPFPGEGANYQRLYDDWLPFAKAVNETFLSTPGPLELGQKLIYGSGFQKDWQRRLSQIMRPYGEVVKQYFKEERISAPLSWMAAQSGPPPTEPMSAPFLLWHPLYHVGGVARPRGGSGGLTKALKRMLEAHGAQVHVNAPVKRFLLEGSKVVGIELLGGEKYTARATVSGTHILETLKMLPDERVPDIARTVRTGNGFGMILRLALNKKVQYKKHLEPESRVGLGLLIKNEAQLLKAYGEYLGGEPTTDPPLIAMSFSAVDESLAPPGGEVLWLWAQYYPYKLSSGSWDTRAGEARENILNAFEHYAPGTRDTIVGELVQTPLWLEQHLGLYNGNVMHLEMSIDQMFGARPFIGGGEYKFPGLENLFLTGASTHPGGGIMGASGRNSARVVLKSLAKSVFKRKK